MADLNETRAKAREELLRGIFEAQAEALRGASQMFISDDLYSGAAVQAALTSLADTLHMVENTPEGL
jgi:hypothetical protein